MKPVFAAVLDSPNHIPPARFSTPQIHCHWVFMGCRHGLAILINDYEREVLVWDPLTGQQHRVPFPPGLRNNGRECVWRWNAAVLCADAEDGHLHDDCFSSPFKLVLVRSELTQTFACLYESVSGAWGNIVSVVTTHVIHPMRPNILVRNAIYWSFFRGDILVFDTEKQTLAVIEKPAEALIADHWSFQLLRTDDDTGLGLAVMSKLSIQLWKRKSSCDGGVGWVLLQKIIQVGGLFPRATRSIKKEARMVGYDEDSNVIVLTTYIGDFMLDLDTMRFTTICKEKISFTSLVHYPYRNFYTAGRGFGRKWVDLEL